MADEPGRWERLPTNVKAAWIFCFFLIACALGAGGWILSMMSAEGWIIFGSVVGGIVLLIAVIWMLATFADHYRWG